MKERTYKIEVKEREDGKKSLIVESWPCRFSFPLVLDGEGDPIYPWILKVRESSIFIDGRSPLRAGDMKYMEKLGEEAQIAGLNYMAKNYGKMVKSRPSQQRLWWMDY